MPEENAALDPRLTGFDWEGKRAAPVEKLIDPHTHYTGKPADLEQLARICERHNVECIFLISPHAAGEESVKEMRSVMGEPGGRFVPYCRIDMATNDPDVVQRACDAGYWGIKFISPSHSYDDHFYDPLYARTQALKMPALFHTGLLGKGEQSRRIGCGMSLMRGDTLDTISSRFPDLLIQGAHLASPNIAEAVLSSMYSPNLYWDACGGPRHMLQVDPKLLAAPLHGRAQLWSRLMWGTDTTTGVFRPEHADGWETYYEYMLASWQGILASMPVPPTTEQLDGFFYKNALTFLEKIRAARG